MLHSTAMLHSRITRRAADDPDDLAEKASRFGKE